jgi:hypothetical protein
VTVSAGIISKEGSPWIVTRQAITMMHMADSDAIPPDLAAEMKGLVAEDRRLDAIKRLHEATGWTFGRAQRWIESCFGPRKASPILSQLSPEDRQVIRECLQYVLHENVNLGVRFELDRVTLEAVLARWPDFEGYDNLAIDKYFDALFYSVNLPGDLWPQTFGVPRSDARRVMRHCRYARWRETEASRPRLVAPILGPKLEAELLAVIKGPYRPLDVIKRIHDETGASILECKLWLRDHLPSERG